MWVQFDPVIQYVGITIHRLYRVLSGYGEIWVNESREVLPYLFNIYELYFFNVF